MDRAHLPIPLLPLAVIVAQLGVAFAVAARRGPRLAWASARPFLAALVIVAGAATLPPPAPARAEVPTYFVAPWGNNSNSCTSQEAPCSSINAAVYYANAKYGSQSNAEIWVAAGSYRGGFVIDSSVQLYAEGDVTITGIGGATITLKTPDDASRISVKMVGFTILPQALPDGYVGSSGSYGIDIPPRSGGGLGHALTLEDVVIRNHRDDFGSGGGIKSRGGVLTVKDSLIEGNKASGEGGGIYAVGGSVALQNSIIRNNQAGSYGGGLSVSQASLTIDGSKIGKNSGVGLGGGINADAATLTNSAVSENTVANGNGGGVFAPTITATNSTFANNRATNGGGLLGTTVTLTNVTIGGNAAAYGGGGLWANGTTTVTNTVIATNTAGSRGPDCEATLTAGSGGHNLLGKNTDCGGLTAGQSGNLVGTAADPLAPRLYALEIDDVVAALELLSGSPANGAGDPATCLSPAVGDKDGRGSPRNTAARGNRCDIGAFDLGAQYPGAPDAPSALKARPGSDGMVLTWTPPYNGGSAITGYTVTCSPACPTGATGLAPSSGGPPTATIGGLTVGTSYTFTLTATNAQGTGPASAPSAAVTMIAVPGAPTNVTAVAGNGAATVTWTAPADNDAMITSYRITCTPYCEPGGSPVYGNPAPTSATLTGLANGTTYTFQVRASNNVGDGPLSAASNAVTPRRSLTKPTLGLASASDSGTAGDGITNSNPPTFAGTGGSGDTITVTQQGASGTLCAATVDAQGGWNCTASQRPDGTYQIVATATADGGIPAASDPLSLTIDTAPPTISVTTPADGGSYARGANLTAAYTCADGSGVASCAGDVASGGALDTSSAGVKSFTARATDNAGNTRTQTVSYTITNPAPTTSAANPAAAPAGGAPVALTVTGANFVPESVVRYDGAALSTTYVSATQLRATVDTARLVEGTAAITVVNPAPGGGASGLQPFFVTASGAGLAGAPSVASSTGGTATATVGGAGAGTAGSVSASATGSGTLVVAQYAANPVTQAPPAATNAYYDVYVPAGGGFTSVTVVTCNLNGGSVVYYWTGTAWVPVSNQTYSPATGCVTLTLDADTTPSVTQLTGTIFAVRNAAPVVAAVAAQSGVYSDRVAFTVGASDAEGDRLTLRASGLPAGLTFTDRGDGTGTIAGAIAAPAGTYTITVVASDGRSDSAPRAVALTVGREDTVVRPAPSNVRAVQVTKPGTKNPAAPEITLRARVTDTADGSFGDSGRATPVTYRLDPIGGGGGFSCAATVTKTVAATATEPGFIETSCTFPAGVKVDVYELVVGVGGAHYQGTGSAVLTVYDPSLGGTNGAGTVALGDGRAGEFAYTASYLKSGGVQGKLLYIETGADGAQTILKGNAMSTLAIDGTTAKLTGKATLNGVGNHSYVLTGVDNGAATDPNPATNPDRFGLQVADPGGARVVKLTFAPMMVGSGNVFVGK